MTTAPVLMDVSSIILSGLTMAMTPGLGTHTTDLTMIDETILPVMHIIEIEAIIHQATILIMITMVITDQITVVTVVPTTGSMVTVTMAAAIVLIVAVTSLIQIGNAKVMPFQIEDLRKTLEYTRTLTAGNPC